MLATGTQLEDGERERRINAKLFESPHHAVRSPDKVFITSSPCKIIWHERRVDTEGQGYIRVRHNRYRSKHTFVDLPRRQLAGLISTRGMILHRSTEESRIAYDKAKDRG